MRKFVLNVEFILRMSTVSHMRWSDLSDSMAASQSLNHSRRLGERGEQRIAYLRDSRVGRDHEVSDWAGAASSSQTSDAIICRSRACRRLGSLSEKPFKPRRNGPTERRTDMPRDESRGAKEKVATVVAEMGAIHVRAETPLIRYLVEDLKAGKPSCDSALELVDKGE